MNSEDKKIWDAVAKTVKPLKKTPCMSPERAVKQMRINHDTAIPEISLQHRSSGKPQIGTEQNSTVVRKLRKRTYRIQARLDLHGLRQKEAYDALKIFLSWAVTEELKLVLVISGKGGGRFLSGDADPNKGVLREKIPQWIEDSITFQGVVSISQARPCDGGHGAFYVELKSKRKRLS